MSVWDPRAILRSQQYCLVPGREGDPLGNGLVGSAKNLEWTTLNAKQVPVPLWRPFKVSVLEPGLWRVSSPRQAQKFGIRNFCL